MNCRTSRQWIHRAIDGELSPGEHDRLLAHLADCGRCRQHRDQLATVEGAIKTLTRLTDDGQIPASFPELPAQRTIPLWPAWTAAAVLMLCSGIWLFSRANPETPGEGRPLAERPAMKPVKPPSSSQPPPVRARVTFPRRDDVIVVPYESENPNVTIIWVYETFRTVNAQSTPETQPSS